MTKLSEIEGIGESYSAKLTGAGITSIENLLENYSEKKRP
jgi:predicted flap endonuclease-1-like 5' DNA nuclease